MAESASLNKALANAKLLITDDGDTPAQENTEYNRAIVEFITATFKGKMTQPNRREIAEKLELDFDKLYEKEPV